MAHEDTGEAPGWSLRDIRDLAWFATLTLFAEIGLRTMPLGRVARLFGASLAHPAGTRLPLQVSVRQQRQMKLIEKIMRHWPFKDVDAMCLRRALLLARLFRDQEPTLRLGVGRDSARGLTAHAWVEVGDRYLGGSRGFTPLELGD
jgi:hypothetical protein